MATFKSLNEVFDGRLLLPANDPATGAEKFYIIPEPDRELGLWCTAFCSVGVAANMGMPIEGEGLPPLKLDDAGEEALYRRLLGPVWDELERDGHGFTTQKLFGMTALLWVGLGEDSAAAFWNSGGDPKASEPRSMRRARARQVPRQTASTPSTDAASTTQSPGSTNGTRPRRRPRGQRPAPGR